MRSGSARQATSRQGRLPRLLAIAALGALLFWRQWTRSAGAPWVPSRRRDVRRMLRLAGVSADDTLYDLGSGDGRVLVEAARTTGARCVGIEIDALRCTVARIRARSLGLGDRIRIVHGDLFDADISEADIVLCYLRQWSNDLLQEKLLAELPPHARVVSNRWRFEGLEPLAERGRLRLYGMPGDRRSRRDGATSKRAASS